MAAALQSYVVESGLYYAGSDVTGVYAWSKGDCAAQCLGNTNCKAWQISQASSSPYGYQCYLKTCSDVYNKKYPCSECTVGTQVWCNGESSNVCHMQITGAETCSFLSVIVSSGAGSAIACLADLELEQLKLGHLLS